LKIKYRIRYKIWYGCSAQVNYSSGFLRLASVD
jgi:hypothetical protein